MSIKKIREEIKRFWNWILHLNLIWRGLIILALICIVLILIFLTLSVISGGALFLAGVESSSMSHQMKIIRNNSDELRLCGNVYSRQEKEELGYSDFDVYWMVCGDWYEENDISKQQFSEFPLKNGFKKGDAIIVWEASELKIGDIIVFKKNSEPISKLIIHRIVSIEDNIIQTKGDNSGRQLSDEINVKQEQIIGKAVMRIPFFGWPKIWMKELIDAFDFIYSK